MLAAAAVVSFITNITFSQLFPVYVAIGAAVSVMALLLSIFLWVLDLAVKGAASPLAAVVAKLRERLPLLVLPAIALPLFMAAFTAAKTAIPFIVGYSWDGFWARADTLIFGDDVWRIATGWLGVRSLIVLQWFYVVAWGLVLAFSSAFVALHASRLAVATFFTAMFATWIVGGVGLAYAMSAAGPVFAHVFEPALSARFEPLQAFLGKNLGPQSPIRMTQLYLAGAAASHMAVKGGGISAFPSMHLGAASIYVLASTKTRWFFPAVGFWITIFICSAYFGYHYWIDGIVAALVAACCWTIVRRYYALTALAAYEPRA